MKYSNLYSGAQPGQGDIKEYRDTKMLSGSDDVSATLAAEKNERTSEGMGIMNEVGQGGGDGGMNQTFHEPNN